MEATAWLCLLRREAVGGLTPREGAIDCIEGACYMQPNRQTMPGSTRRSTMTRMRVCRGLVALMSLVALAPPAEAQVAVSANDNKVVNINGKVTVVTNPPPDTVAVIDLKASPPRVVAEVQAPVSVVGPPLSVAVTPDESLALVTASNKIDPRDPTKQTPDNRVSVIDLKASPPRVVATLEAGMGAGGISINRQGTLALVSNIVDGTVSVFTIQGKTVTPAGTVEVGGPKAGGGMVAIAPDGKTALVSRNADNRVSVLAIDGSRVDYTKRDMTAGVRPIVLDIASSGAFAVVGSLAGGPSGDSDSISLIDLTAKPPRVVDTIGVLGPTRMDYSAVIPLVRSTADQLSRFFDEWREGPTR